MRKVLFRGKRIDNGEWVHCGTLIHFSEGDEYYIPVMNSRCICTHSENDNILSFDEALFFKVHTETIGQYTGLTDKNGKKIFEGDIMTFEAYGFKYIGIVQIIDGNAIILCDNQISPTGSPFLHDAIKRHNAIIISNIHDNPELLKGGEG